MPAWPLLDWPSEAVHAPRSGSGPQGTSVTCGAANVKGAWAELYAATDAGGGYWCMLYSATASSVTATDTASLMDIGFGGAGSEIVVVPDIQMGFRQHNAPAIQFPLYVPGGVRVAARAQSVVASKVLSVCLDILGGPPMYGGAGAARFTAYGVDAANSGGTLVTAAGTADVKGAWAQLTASTSAPIHAFIVTAQGSSNNTTATNYMVDIGVGAAGSEVIVLADWAFRPTSAEDIYARSPNLMPLRFAIPAGVRLAARCSCQTINLDAEIVVHGVTY